mgnify:FL=1
MRTCLLFIATRHRQTPYRNEYEETILPRRMICLLIQHWLYQEHIQTEMSVILSFILLFFEIGDFSCRTKAKTLSMLSLTISPIRQCKYTFFVQYYALILSIISSIIRGTTLSETVKLRKYH